MQGISVFFPLRSGSQRVVGKNTRPFLADGTSIFQHKMNQVTKILDLVDEVIISTDDELVKEQATPFLGRKIKLDSRPQELCLSTTKVIDLINYVPKVVNYEHILWLHATAPFVDELDYKKALSLYEEHVIKGENDSIMSVNKLQQFIWNDVSKRVINVDRNINPWPNTQDLEPLYEINHAFYISSKDNYFKLNDRIGLNPYLFVTESFKKIDIDWEEDFEVASQIAKIKGMK